MSNKLPFTRLLENPRLAGLDLARRVGRYPYFRITDGPTGPTTRMDGKDVINLGSNNYLGLTTHPRVIEASHRAIDQWGTGVTGSRMLNGTLRLHEQLERSLADFYRRESALVFPTGYATNLGVISGLLRGGATAFLDSEAHASLIDGVQLSGARCRRFPHNQPRRVQSLIHNMSQTGATPVDAICVVEGLYSMRGDVADLREYIRICRQYGVVLIDDEAHGLGTLGARGAGAAEELDVLDQVDLVTVTFSKSLASCGGAVIGDRRIIDGLRSVTRPFLFTASNTPASVAAALASLELLREHPEMVDELRKSARFFKNQLDSRGIPTGHNEGPIVTIPVGSDFRVLQAAAVLWNRGIYCNSVLSPAVRRGHGILRFSVMRTHTEEQLRYAADQCGELRPLIEKGATAIPAYVPNKEDLARFET